MRGAFRGRSSSDHAARRDQATAHQPEKPHELQPEVLLIDLTDPEPALPFEVAGVVEQLQLDESIPMDVEVPGDPLALDDQALGLDLSGRRSPPPSSASPEAPPYSPITKASISTSLSSDGMDLSPPASQQTTVSFVRSEWDVHMEQHDSPGDDAPVNDFAKNPGAKRSLAKKLT